MDTNKSDESVELVTQEVKDELVEKVDEAFEHALDITTDKIDICRAPAIKFLNN